MSRLFHMEITITALPATDREGRSKVHDIIEEEINVEVLENDKHYILEGEVTLGGGQTADEWVMDASRAIWSALGFYKPITVVATDLSRAPYETHTTEEEDYDNWKKTQR